LVASGASANTREFAALVVGSNFTSVTYVVVAEHPTRRSVVHQSHAYESLARKGEAMTTAAMATYAYDQIDQARTELNEVSK
jgi:hypothetical protein